MNKKEIITQLAHLIYCIDLCYQVLPKTSKDTTIKQEHSQINPNAGSGVRKDN